MILAAIYWRFCYFGVEGEESRKWVWASMFVLIVEMIFEFTQVISDGWKHITKPTNMFDTFIIVFHIIFLIMYFSEDEYNYTNTNQVLTMSAFAGIFRGVATLFR